MSTTRLQQELSELAAAWTGAGLPAGALSGEVVARLEAGDRDQGRELYVDVLVPAIEQLYQEARALRATPRGAEREREVRRLEARRHELATVVRRLVRLGCLPDQAPALEPELAIETLVERRQA
jgi:hypothetical protein